MALTKSTVAELRKLGITDVQITKLQKLNVSRPQVKTATLAEMGFDPKAVAKLPPNVQKLSKADLMSLGGWGTTKLTPAASKLSVTDVQLIKTTLGGIGGIRVSNEIEIDIYCCCCPCCCAVTVSSPVNISKARSFLN